jgi:4'-phosphopantetheinyl transferase
MVKRDTVYIWWIGPEAFKALTLSRMEERIASWRALLSPKEREKADAFRVEEPRREYIVAHAALRHLLGRCLGVPPGSLEIGGEDGTKPALLPVVNQKMDLRFNLSHTRNAILIGITSGRELGIDTEWQRPMEDLDGMARSVMSDEELSIWSSLEPAVRLTAFYHLWTRKESYLKAIGLGLFRSLQDVTVPVDTDSIDDMARLVRDRSGPGRWYVKNVPMPKDYSASICCEDGEAVQLATVDFDLAELDQC